MTPPADPTRRPHLTDLFGIEHPIIQAPMGFAHDEELAIAVATGGGLGSLPCGALAPDAIRQQLLRFRERARAPINLNFFCHAVSPADPEREQAWRAQLAPYFAELGVGAAPSIAGPPRGAFGDAACALVEELRPEVVSFHFGLPDLALLDRVRATGAKVISSATTVEEARWLAARGCAAIIAQGAEAGGHRGMFLTTDVGGQVGTLALVPQIVDAVGLPVIAAGGITDGRGIAAALALGAAGVQIGTAYLRCPEARISREHRAALATTSGDATCLTNVFTGRPARAITTRFIRELGALRDDVPTFPGATALFAPLREAAEARGSTDFSMWLAGQGIPVTHELGATELTRRLARDAQHPLGELARRET